MFSNSNVNTQIKNNKRNIGFCNKNNKYRNNKQNSFFLIQACKKDNKNKLLSDEVTENDIAEIVAKWTGIPVAKLQQGEREKLLDLDSELHKRVVGQDRQKSAAEEEN